MSARSATPIFGERILAAAQADATTAPPPSNHQFGAGVRFGNGFSIGGSVRYFFYGGPLGVQAEIARVGYDLGPYDWSSTQFSPSVIYRFIERKFEAPVSLTPYAGGGLNFIHSNFDEASPLLPGEDDTSVGVLLFGGAELFFERVPKLGVSGELTYTSNDEVGAIGFGATSLGGLAFTAAAHWYFW